MLNPYVLLAVGIVWLGSVGTAYVTGSRHATKSAKAAAADVLSRSIAAAHAQGVEDMQLEAKSEEKRQAVRIEYRDKIVTVKELINAAPTNCDVPIGYRVRVNELIDTANSQAVTVNGDLSATTKIKDGKSR